MVQSIVFNPVWYSRLSDPGCLFPDRLNWMKKYAGLESQEKILGSFKLLRDIFWINASWFLCGETAKMHPWALEGQSPPSPIEIIDFVVLGWLFVLIGEYMEMRLTKRLGSKVCIVRFCKGK